MLRAGGRGRLPARIPTLYSTTIKTQDLTSGQYFMRLELPEQALTHKVMLVGSAIILLVPSVPYHSSNGHKLDDRE